MRISRREKIFGPGRAVPMDKNAKCRVQAYALFVVAGALAILGYYIGVRK